MFNYLVGLAHQGNITTISFKLRLKLHKFEYCLNHFTTIVKTSFIKLTRTNEDFLSYTYLLESY